MVTWWCLAYMKRTLRNVKTCWVIVWFMLPPQWQIGCTNWHKINLHLAAMGAQFQPCKEEIKVSKLNTGSKLALGQLWGKALMEPFFGDLLYGTFCGLSTWGLIGRTPKFWAGFGTQLVLYSCGCVTKSLVLFVHHCLPTASARLHPNSYV